MSVAQINSKAAEAVAAIEAGDWATALTKLRVTKALLAILPTSRNPEISLEWDRAAIDSLIRDVTRQASASAGIRRTKITYRNVDAGDCD